MNLQISDLHISHLRDADRIENFRKFVYETLDVIKPPVIIASGDLTDGRGRNYLTSHENDEEWEIYKEILKTANVVNRTKWLDLQGNHGEFNTWVSYTNMETYLRNTKMKTSKNAEWKN